MLGWTEIELRDPLVTQSSSKEAFNNWDLCGRLVYHRLCREEHREKPRARWMVYVPGWGKQ